MTIQEKMTIQETKHHIDKVILHYIDDELKDFNEQYNDSNVYWDEKQEIELAIKDNWDACKYHVFVSLFKLNEFTRNSDNDEKRISKLVTQVAEVDDNLSRALDIMTDEQVKEWVRVTSE